jgi:hypothetical protein
MHQFHFQRCIIHGNLFGGHRQNDLLVFRKSQVLIFYQVQLAPDYNDRKNQADGNGKLKYDQPLSYGNAKIYGVFFLFNTDAGLKGRKKKCRIQTCEKGSHQYQSPDPTQPTRIVVHDQLLSG